MRRFDRIVAVMLTLATMVAACSSSNNDGEQPITCGTRTTGYSSPSPGVLTLTGNFFQDETVILKYTSGGQNQQMTLTPPTDRSQLTFIGLPSGVLEYDVVISCGGGQEDLGRTVYHVQ